MVYNDYFTPQDQKYINNNSYFYKFKTHLTITFNRNLKKDYYYLHQLVNFLHSKDLDFKFFGWDCKAKKKKRKNSHIQTRKHAHIIIFSKNDVNGYLDDFFKEIAQDSELKGNIEDYHTSKIYDINGMLEYIHDGHHDIYKTVYKVHNTLLFRYFHNYTKVVVSKQIQLIEVQKEKVKTESITKKSEPEIKISLSLFFVKVVKFKIKKTNYSYKLVKYLNST
jgi:hypothetical protein